MSRVRDVLQRFRPSGAPGAATAAGVPVDRRRRAGGRARARLRPPGRDGTGVRGHPRPRAAGGGPIRARDAERARGVVAAGRARVEAERAAAAARSRGRGEAVPTGPRTRAPGRPGAAARPTTPSTTTSTWWWTPSGPCWARARAATTPSPVRDERRLGGGQCPGPGDDPSAAGPGWRSGVSAQAPRSRPRSASLALTTYGSHVRPDLSLLDAQRAVVNTVAWNIRVLAGWTRVRGWRMLRAHRTARPPTCETTSCGWPAPTPPSPPARRAHHRMAAGPANDERRRRPEHPDGIPVG